MSRQVVDISSGKNVVISDPDKTKSTRYFAESERLEIQRNTKRADCASNPNEKPVREEIVLGVRALVYESKSKLGSQLLKLTQWLAPDLRCAEVRIVAEKLNQNREVIARTEKVPVAIRMGDPDGDCFRFLMSILKWPLRRCKGKLIKSATTKMHQRVCRLAGRGRTRNTTHRSGTSRNPR